MNLPHELVEGIRHPLWSQAIDPTADEATVRAFTDAWLDALEDDLGDVMRVRRKGITVLTCAGSREGVLLAESAARYRDRVLAELPTVARVPTGGLVVLQLQAEAYYRYISRYHPAGDNPSSAGLSLRVGRPHLVVCHVDLAHDERVLAHEVAHGLLTHRDLPLWLEEGIATTVETVMLGQRPGHSDRERRVEAIEHFAGSGVAAFLDGSAFQHAEGQRETYLLAEWTLARLRGRFDDLGAFIAAASAKDRGEVAATEVLGIDLAGFVQEPWSRPIAAPAASARLALLMVGALAVLALLVAIGAAWRMI